MPSWYLMTLPRSITITILLQKNRNHYTLTPLLSIRGWESTHVTAKNDSIIQCVSIFAIGFARHFVAEGGGDMSITNSNSNFGAVALESTGFRNEAFDRDDVGYITHIIPPREPDPRESNITWLSLDAEKIVSAAKTERLYVFGYNSKDVPPSSQIDSYRLGAKRGEEINLEVIIGTEKSNFRSPVLMPVPSGIGTSSQKVYRVGRNAGINSISQSIFTLTDDHQLFNGEKVRLVSDTGEVPNNVEQDKLYFAFTTGLNADQIKLSSTLNDTINGTTIGGISNNGGELRIVSFVLIKILVNLVTQCSLMRVNLSGICKVQVQHSLTPSMMVS